MVKPLRFDRRCDSGIEDMNWTCGCKFCQKKEDALSWNNFYQMTRIDRKPIELDPLKFEIQEECTCECCEDIKYCCK